MCCGFRAALSRTWAPALMTRPLCSVPMTLSTGRACVCSRPSRSALTPRPSTPSWAGSRSSSSSRPSTTKRGLTWSTAAGRWWGHCRPETSRRTSTTSRPWPTACRSCSSTSRQRCSCSGCPWPSSTTRSHRPSMRCRQSTARPHSPRTTMSSSWRSPPRRPQRLASLCSFTRSPLRESTAPASTTTGPWARTPALISSTQGRPTRHASSSSLESHALPTASSSTTTLCGAPWPTRATITGLELRRPRRRSFPSTRVRASRRMWTPLLLAGRCSDTRLRRRPRTRRPRPRWALPVAWRTATELRPSHSAATASSSVRSVPPRTAPSRSPLSTP
mmetsp:Transcript_73915/g.209340  ORF Transcript_73915/g.209340 Transcript_73915/m.209340 type:complete len:333 (+) Transcript_73915:403-1401(+)